MIDEIGWNFIKSMLAMIGFMVLYDFTEPWLAYAFALCMISLRLGEIGISVRETKKRTTT